MYKVWLISVCLFLGTCRSKETKSLTHFDNFDGNLDQWVVEQQPGGKSFIGSEGLEVIDSLGCTIWFRHKLEAPLSIQYEVEVIGAGGIHDRVSDLNCFWMANDPDSPEGFFKNSVHRAGKFTNYHELKLYYVGYGGHHNTKTRFRRYNGELDRPLLPQHDLSNPEFMIIPNQSIKIEITVRNGMTKYLRDGEVIFEYMDANPYKSGYFGFRTVNNHMIIKNFKVLTR